MNDFDFLTESVYEVEALQQECLDLSVATLVNNDPDLKIEYNHYLYALMEKQALLYTRLQLINNPDYRGLSDAIELYVNAMGRDREGVVEFHRKIQQEAIDSLSELTGELIDPTKIELDIRWEE